MFTSVWVSVNTWHTKTCEIYLPLQLQGCSCYINPFLTAPKKPWGNHAIYLPEFLPCMRALVKVSMTSYLA